jgi:hypothetical protein
MLAMAAVLQTGLALRHVRPEIRYSRALTLSAVRQNGDALKYATEEWRKDRKIVLEAVRKRGCALQYATKELRGDVTVVLAALRQDGRALQHVADELKRHRRLVLMAVRRHGYALRYVPENLRRDREVILAALARHASALQFADAAVLNDPAFLKLAVPWLGDAPDSCREEVTILRPSGESTTAPLGLTAQEMKARAQRAFGVPAHMQRLILEGHEAPMEDEEVPIPETVARALASAGFRRLPTITLVVTG